MGPLEPRLQMLEASKLGSVVFGRIELEQPLLAHRFALASQQPRNIFRRQRGVIENCPGNRLSRLIQCEPGECLKEQLHPVGSERDR
jgi:hypothetical protein